MIQGETYKVLHGNNLEVLPTLEANSVDSIVTDPPYELGFMGKKWDNTGIAYNIELWKECLRVLKPGGHLLAFSGSRTYHRMVVAIEDAGFDIRDLIAWISNKTFPKSHNLDGDWKGWGTALKPTVEPIVMARKPLIGTVAENVLTYGTGGLNIDGSRIAHDESVNLATIHRQHATNPIQFGEAKSGDVVKMYKEGGRWPANVILDEHTAGLLDEQSGISKDGVAVRRNGNRSNGMFPVSIAKGSQDVGYGDSGGASRFFYVAKASKRDRNEGLEALENVKSKRYGDRNSGSLPKQTPQSDVISKNFHPTVKPTALMKYLVKLVTPPNGLVLDPFTGSGSTGKAAILSGFRFVGIELTDDYLQIIEGRLRAAERQKIEGEGLF